mmetsp:Transcript_47186/g.120379  ORF Transcript_47186/g.120379 Transcript_47186/m.120379 type:complete len:273 (+) Transcript_47186:796-1614(+)
MRMAPRGRLPARGSGLLTSRVAARKSSLSVCTCRACWLFGSAAVAQAASAASLPGRPPPGLVVAADSFLLPSVFFFGHGYGEILSLPRMATTSGVLAGCATAPIMTSTTTSGRMTSPPILASRAGHLSGKRARSRSTMGVSTNCGQMATSLSCCACQSLGAMERTKCTTPALEAAYTGSASMGKMPPADASARMMPPGAMQRAAREVPWMTAERLTSSTFCHSEVSACRIAFTPDSPMPALRTTTAGSPQRARCAAKARSWAATSATSSPDA